MKEKKKPKKKSLRARLRPLLRWALIALGVVFVTWLAIWLTERSLKSSARRRNFQSWLEDSLNADVDFSGSVAVRLNLVRSSRLGVNRLEIDHPNIISSGKFITAERVNAWAPPWSVFKVWPGVLDVEAEQVNILIEENEAGEWSTAGLMNPLVSPEADFPYTVPRLSGWEAHLEDSFLILRRRGLELRMGLRGTIASRVGSDQFSLRLRQAPVHFGAVGAEERTTGSFRQLALAARFVKPPGMSPSIIPEHGSVQVDNVPLAILPFLFPGIPTTATSGSYQGRIGLREAAPGSYLAELDGQINDVNLSVFGLPNNAPLRARWPLGASATSTEATLHIGPSGFGAFQIAIPFDLLGNPKLLNLKGDVAALDDLPSLLTKHSTWLDWLSRRFPSIEWHSGQWLAFGWTGENMTLRLTRTAAGLNLFGEGNLHGGRVRVALSPTDRSAGMTVAAERINAAQTAAKLVSMLPDPLRVVMTGEHANLTWNGSFPEREGELSRQWGSAMVLSRPVFELEGAGAWWRELARGPLVVAERLPDWGGGDATGLEVLAGIKSMGLDQLSLVTEKTAAGMLRVEFVGFGDALGQIAGWVEANQDAPGFGGEFYLTGNSRLVSEVRRANPHFGRALDLLIANALGLRVTFRWQPETGIVFELPFLDDAWKIRDDAQARLQSQSQSQSQSQPQLQAQPQAEGAP